MANENEKQQLSADIIPEWIKEECKDNRTIGFCLSDKYGNPELNEKGEVNSYWRRANGVFSPDRVA